MIRSSMNSVNLEKQIIRWYLIKKRSCEFEKQTPSFKYVTITDFNLASFVSLNRQVKEFTRIKHKKVEFVKNDFCIISTTLTTLQFGRCFKIYEDNGQLKVIFLKYNIVRFNELLFCYEVEPTNDLTLLNLENNLCHITLFTINRSNSNNIYIQNTF